jgi:hypothetical protein
MQYTIGRAFLQEAYIIADYERQSFSMAQAKWGNASVGLDIKAILPVISPGGNGKAEKIAGISVGATLAVIIIATVFALFLRRRSNLKLRQHVPKSAQEVSPVETASRQLHEADDFIVTPKELDGRERRLELDSINTVYELPANSKRQF